MRLARQSFYALVFVVCTGAIRGADSWAEAALMTVCSAVFAYWFVQELFRRDDG